MCFCLLLTWSVHLCLVCFLTAVVCGGYYQCIHLPGKSRLQGDLFCVKWDAIFCSRWHRRVARRDHLSENLEILGTLTAVRKMPGSWPNVGSVGGKSRHWKQLIANFTFGVYQCSAASCICLYHAVKYGVCDLNKYGVCDLNLGRSAAKSRGILRCLKSGDCDAGEYCDVWRVVTVMAV